MSNDPVDRVAAAADELYALPPEQFTDRRAELVKAIKPDDAAAAKAIGALRKPTVAASVVNRYVLDEPDAVDRLTGMGDRLRRAQRDLDATAMRELTTERRALVAGLTKAAFGYAERTDPPTGLRDEVSATFDAALADPDVAQRLGRLVRAEQFSGFGLATGPALTLVTGGKSRPRKATKKPARKTEAPAPDVARSSKRTPAPARRLVRAAEKARDVFEAAESDLSSAAAAAGGARKRIDELGREIAGLQRELVDAKRDLETARKSERSAKSSRRQARSALDRAERRLAESE